MKDGAAYFRLIQIQEEQKVEWLEERHPGVAITRVYDASGTPIFPAGGLYLRKGWHLQLFGQPSDLIQFASRCS
jgi:hypothetical protein